MAGCILLSGAAALVYEVVWARLLGLVMGHTVYALSAVLTSFLGGLALGAWLAGQWTRRRGASLRLYAAIELGIAAFAAAMPWLIDACTPLFGAAYRELGERFVVYNLVQFAVCGGLLLLPTVLMGATLPVVVSMLLARPREIASGTGRLYAVNTVGGALGAAAAGFVLLPRLGMHGTLLAAGCVNLSVAGIAYWLALRRPSDALTADAVAPSASQSLPETHSRSSKHNEAASSARGRGGRTAAPDDWPAPPLPALVALYGLAGFSSLVLQVGWVRIVSLSIGSTTYGFTITLVSFITGLGIGSYAVGRIALVARRPVAAIFWLNAVISLASLASLPFLGSLPVYVLQLVGRTEADFSRVLWGELLMVAGTILLPTLAMGAMFPLAAQLAYRRLGESGQAVGAAYAANTLGNIAGSFVAGFVLVPWIGMRGTVVASAVVSAAVAAGFLVPAIRTRQNAVALRLAGLAAAVVLLVVITPAWDPSLITSGPMTYAKKWLISTKQHTGRADIEAAIKRDELIEYREGASTVIAVKRSKGTDRLDMFVGGYSEAASGAATQNIIAHLPMLLHGNAKTALVIGLGSGNTLGAVLRHPVEHVDCVEISPDVVDVARQYFSKYTGGAPDDPRARIIIGDGRNHLRHCQKQYDVIVSQPSYPWVSGAAGMFTRECFADMREHLAPGGIACIWYTSWTNQPQDVQSLLRTFSDVFPSAYFFETRTPATFVLVGLRDVGKLSAANMVAAIQYPAARRDLEAFRIADPVDLLGNLLLGPEAMRRYSQDAPVNTDDNAYIEFKAAAGMLSQSYRDYLREIAVLQQFREPAHRHVDFGTLAEGAALEMTARLDGLYRSKSLLIEARTIEDLHGITPRWRELMRQAAVLNPDDPYVRQMARYVAEAPR